MTAPARRSRRRSTRPGVLAAIRPRSLVEALTCLASLALVGGGVLALQQPAPLDTGRTSAIRLDEDGSGTATAVPPTLSEAASWLRPGRDTPPDTVPRGVAVIPRPTPSQSLSAAAPEGVGGADSGVVPGPAPTTPNAAAPNATAPNATGSTPRPGPATPTPSAPAAAPTTPAPGPAQPSTPVPTQPSPDPTAVVPQSPAQHPSTPAPAPGEGGQAGTGQAGTGQSGTGQSGTGQSGTGQTPSGHTGGTTPRTPSPKTTTRAPSNGLLDAGVPVAPADQNTTRHTPDGAADSNATPAPVTTQPSASQPSAP